MGRARAAAAAKGRVAQARNARGRRGSGQVYVAGWSRTKGTIARVYAWGIGVDAPKPPAYSGYERVKRVRANESQEDKDFRLARERAARRKIKVHPLMAAFYSIPK